MNTDRSSSTHTRRIQSRFIATYNNNIIAANKSGILTLKNPTNNPDASIKTYINVGNLDVSPVTEVIEPGPPGPPPTPPTAFIPTTWIDSTGDLFVSTGGRDVSYGQGKWIAVGLDVAATIKMSSDHAATWTNISDQMPSDGNGHGVLGVATDGYGKWVAVGDEAVALNYVNTILYSSDNGLTWASNNAYDSGFNNSNGSTDRGYDVTYNNGLWIAVGHYTTTTQYERVIKIATTFDLVNGPNWSNSPIGIGPSPVFGSSNPGLCVAYGNGVWCVGGQDLNTIPVGSIAYSNNGLTWTMGTNTFKGMCSGIATDGNGNWVAVGFKKSGAGGDAKSIKYSSDGINWIDTPSSDANLFTYGKSVAYGLSPSGVGIWVAVGSGNSQTIIYSIDNGLSWSSAGSNRFSTTGHGIHFADDRWVAVGDDAASIKYSVA